MFKDIYDYFVYKGVYALVISEHYDAVIELLDLFIVFMLLSTTSSPSPAIPDSIPRLRPTLRRVWVLTRVDILHPRSSYLV